MTSYIVIIAVIAIIGGIIYLYNNLVAKKNAVKNSW